jgi:hypothetical protein
VRRARRDARQIEAMGSTPVGREPQALQLLAVELGVAKRQVDVAGQAGQILTPERRDPEDLGVIRRKEMRRA